MTKCSYSLWALSLGQSALLSFMFLSEGLRSLTSIYLSVCSSLLFDLSLSRSILTFLHVLSNSIPLSSPSLFMLQHFHSMLLPWAKRWLLSGHYWIWWLYGGSGLNVECVMLDAELSHMAMKLGHHNPYTDGTVNWCWLKSLSSILNYRLKRENSTSPIWLFLCHKLSGLLQISTKYQCVKLSRKIPLLM